MKNKQIFNMTDQDLYSKTRCELEETIVYLTKFHFLTTQDKGKKENYDYDEEGMKNAINDVQNYLKYEENENELIEKIKALRLLTFGPHEIYQDCHDNYAYYDEIHEVYDIE